MPEYIKDTTTVADPRDPKNKDAKIEVEYEVPQATNWADAHAWAGGEDKSLEFFNAAVAAKAVNGAKLKEIQPLDENVSESQLKSAVARMVSAIRNYIPTVGRSQSASKFVNALKDAISSGKDMSNTDLVELAKSFGVTL